MQYRYRQKEFFISKENRHITIGHLFADKNQTLQLCVAELVNIHDLNANTQNKTAVAYPPKTWRRWPDLLFKINIATFENCTQFKQ